MHSHPTIQETKDAHRDAASLLLHLLRGDMEAVEEIFRHNMQNPAALLSGMIAIAGMIVEKVFEDDTEDAMRSLLDYLATVPDDVWATVSENATWMDLSNPK